jgi:hypothetical protein
MGSERPRSRTLAMRQYSFVVGLTSGFLQEKQVRRDVSR